MILREDREDAVERQRASAGDEAYDPEGSPLVRVSRARFSRGHTKSARAHRSTGESRVVDVSQWSTSGTMVARWIAREKST